MPGAVAHRHVKHWPARPRAKRTVLPPPLATSPRIVCTCPGMIFGDLREADAVLVAERQIAEQVADGRDAALFEHRGALRADAAQILHRIVQGDGHATRITRWKIVAQCGTRPAAGPAGRPMRGYLPSTENASSTLPAVLP